MSDAAVMMFIGIVSFLASAGLSLFVSGARWGRLSTDVENIKADITEIRKLFSLKLIDTPSDKDS